MIIRNLLFLLVFYLVYRAIRTVIRSAFRAYSEEEGVSARLKGEEMVLDPECHTYVVKDRALTRRFRGEQLSFCSEACAERYEQKHRD